MSNAPDLATFFEAYGAAFKDGTKLAGFFDDCALASAPSFVGCLKGTDEVRAAMTGIAEYQVRTAMTSVAPTPSRTRMNKGCERSSGSLEAHDATPRSVTS